MKTFTTYDEDQEILLELDDLGYEDPATLVVYNDDINTFDWVIQCLMEVCGHSFEQSEQLSLLIHFKGKATVKTAPFDTLRPLKDALVDRGLSAVIEGIKQPN
jgi:ATP-dependent Clp protease adaptor protein ClpS